MDDGDGDDGDKDGGDKSQVGGWMSSCLSVNRTIS